jgi:thioredoxin 1
MSEKIKLLDDDNFASEVAAGVTLVDFYADWCGPCRMMTPVIEEIADELSGKLKVAKLDIDSSQKTTAAFEVTSIPTLILFKGGKEIRRIVGLKDGDTLKKMITPEL